MLDKKAIEKSKLIFSNYHIRENARISLIGILAIIITFPQNEWTFTVGTDPPLSWVYNHLFHYNINLGKDIIFPHGPLAFLMYPLHNNILVSTIISSALKLLLVFSTFKISGNHKNVITTSLIFAAVAFLLLILNFNQLVLANLILLYCIYFLHKKLIIKILIFAITAIAFYIKAYIAIISGILFASHILYTLQQNRRLKPFIIDSLVLASSIFIIWLVIYQSHSGFIRYCIGVIKLSLDNSSAVSLYPYNNWWVLTAFIVSLILVFFNKINKKTLFYSSLIALSLFAAWKHGIAREDYFHLKNFFNYILICCMAFMLFTKTNYIRTICFSVLALSLFLFNWYQTETKISFDYNLNGVSNFYEFTTDFENLMQNSLEVSKNNIAKNKLPDSIINIISESTVDVYPWDYSIIAANNLNWKPRVVINSYASYTQWLDKQNAKHFSSDESPEFVIIEKISFGNLNGGVFSSIDHRYLLNDEPQTILELINKGQN